MLTGVPTLRSALIRQKKPSIRSLAKQNERVCRPSP